MKYINILFLMIAIPVIGIAQPFWYDEIKVHQNGRQILNPWNGGLITTSIAMPDLDQDGDADLLFVGSGDGRIYHYTNDSQGVEGRFSPVNLNFGRLEFPNQWLRMAFHDWDDDGYLDLFLGRSSGKIDYYHNTGASMMFPEFTQETVFFDSIDVGVIATPVFADLNGDGLDDLLIGDYEKGLFYYRRQTSGTSAFVFEDTLRNHLGQVIERVYGSYAPALADLDADGDLDLLLGSTRTGLAFYRNTGSVTHPEFTLENEDYILPSDNLGHLTPVLVDIENDGDYDLFMGAENGQVLYYRNEGTATYPNFQLVSPQLPIDFLDFGRYAVPRLVDLDNDSDLDFFVNTEYGQLYRFKNTGTPTEPVFERDENPFVTLKNA